MFTLANLVSLLGALIGVVGAWVGHRRTVRANGVREPKCPRSRTAGGSVYRYGAHVGWVRGARAAWYERAAYWVAFDADGERVGWGRTLDEAAATL